MRITYLYQANGATLFRSGAPRVHVFSIIQSLQRLGHQVQLLTLYRRGVLVTDDVDSMGAGTVFQNGDDRLTAIDSLGYRVFESGVRRAQTSLGSPYLALFDSRRIYNVIRHDHSGVDVIHERANLQCIGGALASRRLGIPLVLEFNGDPMNELDASGHGLRGIRRSYAKWATRFTLISAANVICVSTSLKEYLIRVWNVDAVKIIVLPNGADVDRFGGTRDTQPLKTELGLEDEPIIVWIGGFYIWHDLTLLLESFALVLQVFPCARLLLVGDGETLPQIRSEILRLNLQDNIILTGRVDYEKVPELLALADIAVAPFAERRQYGGSPLKVYEYMAAGKAVVATKTGQLADVIQDYHSGIGIEPGNVEQFAEAMKLLLTDRELCERLGKNARKQAVDRHSWTGYARRLEDIYASVADTK